MKKVSEIVTSSKRVLFNIILNWSEIVGNSNRDIMILFQIKNKVLSVAVPNGMVAKTVARLKGTVIEKINSLVRKKAILDISFVVSPSRFPDQIKRAQAASPQKISVPSAEIRKRAAEMKKNGLSDSLAETFAEIELLLKNKNNSK